MSFKILFNETNHSYLTIPGLVVIVLMICCILTVEQYCGIFPEWHCLLCFLVPSVTANSQDQFMQSYLVHPTAFVRSIYMVIIYNNCLFSQSCTQKKVHWFSMTGWEHVRNLWFDSQILSILKWLHLRISLTFIVDYSIFFCWYPFIWGENLGKNLANWTWGQD